MKKALLLGDYNAQYHPLTGVDKELLAIFGGSLDITIDTDYAGLTLPELQQYDMLIDYIDQWGKNGSDVLAGAMLAYVARGGLLLSIHGGIIKWGHYELCAMQGGSFIMHPPYTRLSFAIDSRHPIGAAVGTASFALEEEPYGFEMDAFMEAEYFLSYQYGEITKPAGWTRKFAKGYLAYIVPGHNLISFQNHIYRKLLLETGKWLCARETV